MAEQVGFEPTERSSRSTVFKTASIDHSDTAPTSAMSILILIDRQPGNAKPAPRPEPGSPDAPKATATSCVSGSTDSEDAGAARGEEALILAPVSPDSQAVAG